jgi:hypothetical protein
MKKIKWSIMTLVIVASVSFAFAGRPRALQTLYYWNGTQYWPVGILGENYVCEAASPSSVCTYTYSNGNYVPYETGSIYVPVGLTAAAKPKPAEKKAR